MERSLARDRSADPEGTAGVGLAGSPHGRGPVAREGVGESAHRSLVAPSMPDAADAEFLAGLRAVLEETLEAGRGRAGANLLCAQALLDGAILSSRLDLLAGGGARRREELRAEIPNFIHLIVLALADPEEAERARAQAFQAAAADHRGGLLQPAPAPTRGLSISSAASGPRK